MKNAHGFNLRAECIVGLGTLQIGAHMVLPEYTAGEAIIVSSSSKMGTAQSWCVVRATSQYAITPGYAFTDYKSQGQTIEHVVVNIGKPPTGKLSPFGVYVAFSRSRGRDTTWLLREFDEELIQHHPSEHLRKLERYES